MRRWAEQIGVEPKEIHVRPRRAQVGLGFLDRRTHLDTGLLREPPDKRSEIIVHELAHLKVGNHGRCSGAWFLRI